VLQAAKIMELLFSIVKDILIFEKDSIIDKTEISIIDNGQNHLNRQMKERLSVHLHSKSQSLALPGMKINRYIRECTVCIANYWNTK